MSWPLRAIHAAAWVLPSITLALLPKCPMCVAAYVALATGLGISLPAAASLRMALMVTCMAALVFLAGRLVANAIAKARRHAPMRPRSSS